MAIVLQVLLSVLFDSFCVEFILCVLITALADVHISDIIEDWTIQYYTMGLEPNAALFPVESY